jgi:hypothetical protein
VPPATPYLIVRSWPDDLGIRPIPSADAASLYFSPDIGLGIHAPIVEAWITNAGLAAAAPVRVELYRGSPSLTYPSPDLALVATDFLVMQPRSSERVLFDLAPFAFPVYGSIVVRCSTPFDRCLNTLDPLVDRHVAIQNAGAPEPGGGGGTPDPLDLRIANWFTAPSTDSVEMVAERLQVTTAYRQSEEETRPRSLMDDLLRFGEHRPDLAQHLEYVRTKRGIRSRSTRGIRRAVCAQVPQNCYPSGLHRSQASPVPSQVPVEAEVKPGSRRFYPTAASLKTRNELLCGAGSETLSRLPSHRQTLIERLELAPLEEREIRLRLRDIGELRWDEVLVVHLFHINNALQSLMGRFNLVVVSKDRSPFAATGLETARR